MKYKCKLKYQIQGCIKEQIRHKSKGKKMATKFMIVIEFFYYNIRPNWAEIAKSTMATTMVRSSSIYLLGSDLDL